MVELAKAERIREMLEEGMKVSEIAAVVGCRRSYVYKVADDTGHRRRVMSILEDILAEQREQKTLLRRALGIPDSIIARKLKQLS